MIGMLQRDIYLRVPVLGPVVLLLCSLLLASCAPFSGFVSDHWPTWAGGMPNDVPPRPGAPGYDEFMAHQQSHDAAATPADATTQATPVVASPNKPGSRTPAPNEPANNSGIGQGGLY
jgi:hypothetical protein